MAIMKNKNESSATKGKVHFNLVDAFLVVLVLAILLGTYFRFSIVDKLWAQTQTKEYTVSFSVENIRYTTPSYLNIGDKVYFADGGEFFGTLISESENMSVLSIVPASEYFVDAEGNLIEVFYPDDESRVNAKGRIQCEGYYDENGGFSTGDRKYLAPGQSVTVCTELVTLTVNVISIDLVESEP